SMSDGDIAPQLIGRYGPAARLLPSWMTWATRSLPVPLSPTTSTAASVGATRAISVETRRMAGDSPTSRPKCLRRLAGSGGKWTWRAGSPDTASDIVVRASRGLVLQTPGQPQAPENPRRDGLWHPSNRVQGYEAPPRL